MSPIADDRDDRALTEWISQAIAASDLSQTAIAKAVGTDQGTVSKWKSGTQTISAPQLLRLERVLKSTFRPDLAPAQVFERGFAAGEFDALAAMAEAIAERAAAARDRLRQGATPVSYEALGTRARLAVAEAPPPGSVKAPRRKASSR